MSLITSNRIRFPCYVFNVTKRFTLTKRKLTRPLSKPPTLPPAKTKRYHVVNVPWQKPEDVQELLWRRHVYLDALSSIRFAYRKEWYERRLHYRDRPETPPEVIASNRAHFDAFLQRVAEHNQNQAHRREERLKKELDEMEVATLKILEKHLRISEENKAKREKQVNDLIENVNNFITAENAEEKIAESLETIVDYGYAVDTDGSIYRGNNYKKYLEESYMVHHKVSLHSAPAIRSGKLSKIEDDRLKYSK